MAARWILSLVQFRFGHPNQWIICISFIFSSVINCSFPGISPCKHCFQFHPSGGLACVSLSSAVVSDCLCLHQQVTDHINAIPHNTFSTVYLISSGHSSPIYLADKFFYQSVYFIRLVRIGIMTSILYPFKR